MRLSTNFGWPIEVQGDTRRDYPSRVDGPRTDGIDEQLHRAISVLAATGTRNSPATTQVIDLTTLQGKAGTLLSHNGTGIVCDFSGIAQITGRLRFSTSGGGYSMSIAGQTSVTTGNVIKGWGSFSSTYLRGGVDVAGVPWTLNEEFFTAAAVTAIAVDITIRPIVA